MGDLLHRDSAIHEAHTALRDAATQPLSPELLTAVRTGLTQVPTQSDWAPSPSDQSRGA